MLPRPNPNSTQPNPTQPDPTQPDPTQPNPTQPNPTQPNPTQPNPTQPNPTYLVPTIALIRLTVCFVLQVYRVMDNVTYSVVIEEFDSEKGGWGPYTADDVQVTTLRLQCRVCEGMSQEPVTK